MKKIEVLQVVIGTLGTVTKHFRIDREIWIGLDNWNITEALFTWNGQNNTESVGYKTRQKNEAAKHKTTGWRSLFWHGNNNK